MSSLETSVTLDDVFTVVGAKRVTREPSLLTRNLVKFHLMPSLPKMPGAECLRYL